MANYIVTRNKEYFQKIGDYKYLDLTYFESNPLPDLIALDTETTSLSPRFGDIFCIQVGTGKDNYIFDLQRYPQIIGENLITTIEEVWPIINKSEWVLQNAAFDLGFFYKHNMFIPKVWDTFLASKILYNGSPPSLRHDFGTIMKRELDVYYDKTDQKNIHKVQLSQPSTIQYSFNDVDRLLELHEVLVKKLKEYGPNNGAYPSYLLHCDYIRALAYFEQCGLPINPKLWKDKMDSDRLRTEKAKEIVKDYIFDNLPKYRDNQLSLFDTEKKLRILLSSPKQMISVFKDFKINVVDKDGKESIEEDIIKKSDHEFVKLWIAYKKAEHDVTTFGQTIYDQIWNGRIYTSFNPIVDTARISTRKGGINFLNFPSGKDTRSCFEANPGYVMVVSDYSAQEAKIIADLSRDEAMLRSVVNGEDLHCLFAKKIFPELEGLTDEEIIRDHKAKRNSAKAPRFAFSFGGSGFTVATNLNIPLEEGNKLEAAFKELHKGMYEWGDRVLQQALKLGYIESADGFKLKLPDFEEFTRLGDKLKSCDNEFWDEYRSGKEEYKNYWEAIEYNKTHEDKKIPSIKNTKAYEFYRENKSWVSAYFKLKSGYSRLALNNPIQARAAHQMKYAVVLLFQYIISRDHLWKVRISNVVHDEQVLEVQEDLVEEYKEKVGYFMQVAGDHYLSGDLVKMEAEGNVGSNWYEAK